MNYQYTLETKIFKWSFTCNWSSGIKTELSPHFSEIGAIFRILSGTAISHSQDPEPEFKGYLMSVTSVCQRAHYIGIHMIFAYLQAKECNKKRRVIQMFKRGMYHSIKVHGIPWRGDQQLTLCLRMTEKSSDAERTGST